MTATGLVITGEELKAMAQALLDAKSRTTATTNLADSLEPLTEKPKGEEPVNETLVLVQRMREQSQQLASTITTIYNKIARQAFVR